MYYIKPGSVLRLNAVHWTLFCIDHGDQRRRWWVAHIPRVSCLGICETCLIVWCSKYGEEGDFSGRVFLIATPWLRQMMLSYSSACNGYSYRIATTSRRYARNQWVEHANSSCCKFLCECIKRSYQYHLLSSDTISHHWKRKMKSGKQEITGWRPSQVSEVMPVKVSR